MHTNLLAGPKGRIVNGVWSIFITLLCLTGAIIWWPGVAKWRRSMMVDPKANWKRLNWELHSVIGFWTFALVFMWAFTGIYLVFPDPFQQAVNHFAPLDYYRPCSTQGDRTHNITARFCFGGGPARSICRRRPTGLRQRQAPPLHPALLQRRHGSALDLLSALRQFRRQQDQRRVGRAGIASRGAVYHRSDHVVEPGA